MEFAYKHKHLHFVGIGGVSMSGLARLCRHLGATVSGSDRTESAALDALRQEGFAVYAGINCDVAARCDLLIYTAAVPKDNPERIAARREMERSRLLGYIASLYPVTIAVAGTHGKTTVTGMLAAILEEAKCAYTAHIGGIIAGQASGTVICGNDIFLTEACEYKRHFLRLKPTLGIVTNVEHDHPDCYADLNAVYDAFGAFARQCQAVVTKDVRIISTLAHTNTFTYSQWSIRPTDINANTYQLTCGYEQLALRLNVWGDFNMQNAAFAAVSALSQGIAPDVIQRGLAAYRGIERRQQYMGQYRGMPIISDYAHHPSEIYAVTAAASRRYGDIAVVYEPHTYSRTMALMKEFGTCFVASAVYLLPTFAAREAPEKGVDEALLEAITVKDKHYADREQTMEALKKMPYKKYGAILLVGAGTVHDFAKQVAALEQE